jgi:hypothetical protein
VCYNVSAAAPRIKGCVTDGNPPPLPKIPFGIGPPTENTGNIHKGESLTERRALISEGTLTSNFPQGFKLGALDNHQKPEG